MLNRQSKICLAKGLITAMNSSFMKVARQKIVVPCAVTIAIFEAAANMQSNGAILLPNKLTVFLPN